mmetsp:Transcript_17502/g.37856  ORF Transcript_17502/g.37856 Transcript_17502/m.37856 type:complete len:112 (-) Transcript_17502:77-412(-)
MCCVRISQCLRDMLARARWMLLMKQGEVKNSLLLEGVVACTPIPAKSWSNGVTHSKSGETPRFLHIRRVAFGRAQPQKMREVFANLQRYGSTKHHTNERKLKMAHDFCPLE